MKGALTSPPRIDRRYAELTIVNSFRRVMRAIRLSATEIQAQTGLSAAQLYVLRQIAEDGKGQSIGELADKTLTDRSSVASVVDRLVALDMASRTRSDEDRRRAEVRITERGREAVASAAPPPTYMMVHALESFHDDDLATLARLLDKMVRTMGIDRTAPTMFMAD